MMYLKHPAWLWLKKNDKAKLPPISAELQAIFDAGNEFEQYAEAQFPDGVRVGFEGYDQYLSMPARTTSELENGTKTIFQGRFEFEKLTFICDVIKVVGERELDLYEIKSSTTAKQDHILDLSFQLTVLEGCGFMVRDIYVLHVNNNYVRRGDISPRELTASTDVTEKVKKELGRTAQNIKDALVVASAKQMPNPSPSHAKLYSYKEWLEVYKNIVPVPEGSIYELCRLNADEVGLIEAQGITMLGDIPVELVTKAKQREQLLAIAAGEPIINIPKIKNFLDKLEYPLYFFDYETLASTVPYFDGTKPYQQVPFQYSLHIIDAPGDAPRHMGYLHADNSNPAMPLSKQLKEHIGQEGSVLTWNMGFEKGCNTTLGVLAPEYANFYERLNERIADLMIIFSKSYYVDARFMGSASLKNVMPVLVAELSYKNLTITEGGTAQRQWMEAILDGKRDNEKEQILADLEKYCKLDTLAMVEIYNFLVKLVENGNNQPKVAQLSLDL